MTTSRKPLAIGSIFGRLKVIDTAPPQFTPAGVRLYQVKAQCQCGKIIVRPEYKLRCGNVQSCGCLNGDAQATHRLSHTPTYNSWAGMLNRCDNPNNKDFHRYGKKGVQVCERWYRFENFYADMGPRPKGTSIDRYPDPHGDYEPTNCRWATPIQQAQNRRNAVFVILDGEKMNASEAARRLGKNTANFGKSAKVHGSYQAATDHFAKGRK